MYQIKLSAENRSRRSPLTGGAEIDFIADFVAARAQMWRDCIT